MRAGLWFAVGFALVMGTLLGPKAWASIPAVSKYRGAFHSVQYEGTTIAEYCAALSGVSWNSGTYCSNRPVTVVSSVLSASGLGCNVDSAATSGPACSVSEGIVPTLQSVCPANSTLAGSVCNCSSGFTESAGGCVPSAGCSAGTTLSTVVTVGWTYNGPDRTAPLKWAVPLTLPTTMCIGGCTVSYTGSGPNVAWVGGTGKCGLGVTQDPATGLYRASCSVQGSTTGSTCSTTGTDPGPAASCPGYVGQVNGKNACLDPGTYSPPATVGGPGGLPAPGTGTGSGTGTGTIGGTGSSGDPGTGTNPINVTIGGGLGGSTGTGTPGSATNPISTTPGGTGTDLGNFCAANPGAAVCASSTVSGGDTCGAMPACSGDAAQCAIVRQTWETRCAIGTAGTASALGEQIAGGSDSVQHPLSNPSSVNLASALDTSDALAGSGCIADKSFSLWDGTTFVLPFSDLCPYLQFMGQIVAAFAMLAAARILMA